MMYGTLFMLGGAYTLSRDAHVRADIFFRLMSPRKQAALELVLYFLFFFPGILALIFAGWKYVSRSWRYLEVSTMSPANIPIYQFKTVIIVAGVLLVHAGHRAGHALHHLPAGRARGRRRRATSRSWRRCWCRRRACEVLRHSGEAVDVVVPDRRRDDRGGAAAMTNPEVAVLQLGVLVFAIMLGFPVAFTLMALGIGFGFYAYYDADAVRAHV